MKRLWSAEIKIYEEGKKSREEEEEEDDDKNEDDEWQERRGRENISAGKLS